ncbi:FOG: Reverse transcriptase [Ceraceosorus bombacis]|uniref:FOG: Reverse transcriptase n=1 Tax=Ceraceosorus bombacis TaxID=401625 RepID=A0A0P1BS47_9BASI|nr:FOG: Reverse transcriptase [Ceraceosorus bombacis]
MLSNSHDDIPQIAGGDWNSWSLRDQFNAPVCTTWPSLCAMFDPLDMVDAYRHQHPFGQVHTHFNWVNNVVTSSRRLDSVWILRKLITNGSVTDTGFVAALSNHHLASVTLKSSPTSSHCRGPGTWHVQRGIWEDPRAQRQLEDWAEEVGPGLAPQIQGGQGAVREWFAFKERLRTVLESIAAPIGKRQRALRDQVADLSHNLHLLDLAHSRNDRARLPSVLKWLTAAQKAEAAASTIQARTQLATEAIRPSSWLAAVNASASFTAMPDLKDSKGVAITPQAKVQVVKRHYDNVYQLAVSTPAQATAQELLFRAIPPRCRLSEAERDWMGRLADNYEVRRAIQRMSTSSAPGLDGLTLQAYLASDTAAVPRLRRLINALLSGAQLPDGEPKLKGVALPKKGDLSMMSNYRPLSIANLDIRIVSKVLAERLQRVTPKIITWNQAGFIRNQGTQDIGILLQGLADFLRMKPRARPKMPDRAWDSKYPQNPERTTQKPSSYYVLLQLDFMKAYDRVLRDYLVSVFAEHHFPPEYINIAKSLLLNATVRYMVEGYLTPSIRLHVGVLQGAADSCITFEISLQPLLHLLEAEGLGVRLPHVAGKVCCVAFADDVGVLIEVETRRQWDTLQRSLGIYCTASNAALNVKKCGFFCMHNSSKGPPHIPDFLRHLGYQNLGVELLHLGHPISLAEPYCRDMMDTRVAGIQKHLAALRQVHTSLHTRVRIVNTLALGRLWHTFSLCAVPKGYTRAVREAILSFLWKGKRAWVKWEVMITPRAQGGFGLIDPYYMALAFSVAIFAKHVLKDTPTGTFLREGFHAYLTNQHYVDPDIDWTKTSVEDILALPWFTPALNLDTTKKPQAWPPRHAKEDSPDIPVQPNQRPQTPHSDGDSSAKEPETVKRAIPRNHVYKRHHEVLEFFGYSVKHIWAMFRDSSLTIADIVWYSDFRGTALANNSTLPSLPLAPPNASAILHHWPSRRGRIMPQGL